MLNAIEIMGRLVADPELKYIESKEVNACTIRIACERDYVNGNGERITDFFTVKLWRATAEFVDKYFKKGSMIIVCGHLENRSWGEGESRRTVTEIQADKAYFGESKKTAEAPAGGAQAAAVAQQSAGAFPADFDPYAGEDMLPDDKVPF